MSAVHEFPGGEPLVSPSELPLAELSAAELAAAELAAAELAAAELAAAELAAAEFPVAEDDSAPDPELGDSPSERDREIYEAICLEHRSAVEVGDRYLLAATTVRNIALETQRRLARRQHQLDRMTSHDSLLLFHDQLARQYSQLNTAWHQSKGNRDIVTKVATRKEGEKPVEKTTTKTCRDEQGETRYLVAAMRVLKDLQAVRARVIRQREKAQRGAAEPGAAKPAAKPVPSATPENATALPENGPPPEQAATPAPERVADDVAQGGRVATAEEAAILSWDMNRLTGSLGWSPQAAEAAPAPPRPAGQTPSGKWVQRGDGPWVQTPAKQRLSRRERRQARQRLGGGERAAPDIHKSVSDAPQVGEGAGLEDLHPGPGSEHAVPPEGGTPTY